MTIETVRAHLPAVQSSTLPTHLAELRAWADTYTEVARFVAPLVQTPFVPAAFRPEAFLKGRPDEQALAAATEVAVASATAAVLFGAAIGFDPLTALQNVYVVGGRPGLYAAAMVAIVQAAGHEVWTEDITDTRAIVCGRRRGGSEERVIVTMEQARKAGWTRNAKYASEPQSMLWARAASTVCRRIAQDALKGIARSVEELNDEVAVEVRPAARTVRPAPRAVEAAPAVAPADAPPAARSEAYAGRPVQDTGLPPLPGEEPAQPEPEPVMSPAVHMASKDQQKALGAAFTGLGVKQREERLAITSRLIGREVTSAVHLTRAEASTLIDTLGGNGEAIVDEHRAEVMAAEAAADSEGQRIASEYIETDAEVLAEIEGEHA